MNRVFTSINAVISGLLMLCSPSALALESSCNPDIETVNITFVGDGAETAVLLDGPVSLRVPLTTIGGIPKFKSLSISSARNDLWELEYYAGTAGTSYMVSAFWKAIIDPCQQKVLGEAEYRTLPQDDDDEWDQPQWIWGADNLYVLDSGYGNTIIPLTPEKLRGAHQFQDYKVAYDPDQTWKELDSSWLEDHHHAEQMIEALKTSTKSDFAGFYKIEIFGCGTGCAGLGVLDKKTGAYFEADFAVHRGFDQSERMITYRADSRLIVLNGSLNEEGPEGTHYFTFDGKKFQQLKK